MTKNSNSHTHNPRLIFSAHCVYFYRLALLSSVTSLCFYCEISNSFHVKLL